MVEAVTKLAVKSGDQETARASTPRVRSPIESLRRDMSRLFEDFGDFWRSPVRQAIFGMEPAWSRDLTWAGAPAVDIVENDKAYEITAELPGMDESNIEVKLSDNALTIRGEKKEEKEEKKKDYYLSERRFGAFERRFEVPSGVDPGKIEANFKKGVLTVTLPKSAGAQAAEKKIPVKAS